MAEPVFSKPKQVILNTDFSKCLICQKDYISEPDPIFNLTELGYKSFKHAVETRTDEIAIRLSPEINDKSEFLKKLSKCHRKCRSNYTNIKTVRQQHKKALVRQDSGSKAQRVQPRDQM